jgi:hypothetical protein
MENQCVFCEVSTFYILISWASLNYWFSAVSITLTFIFMLLLLEGQMSDAWETSKKLFQKSESMGWKFTFIHLN